MKAHKGFFFSFEGNEGSGKSTQIALLAERLQQEGFVVSHWREPGGTALGEALRPIIKQPGEELRMGPMAELLLMNASRAQLVEEVILPRLNQGEIILVDRFYDSTLVYQGLGRGLDRSLVRQAVSLAVGKIKRTAAPSTSSRRARRVRTVPVPRVRVGVCDCGCA